MDPAAVLTGDLRGLALESGAELFGVAELAGAVGFIRDQGGDFVAAFPRAVSIAMQLSPAMVEQVADHQSAGAIRTYRHYVYQVVNPSLDRIADLLARRLVREGYRAYPVPASDSVDSQRLAGVFSHKLAAHLAGLGFIGKSCFLVTPQFGGRVRLATVLTDAPLEAGSPAEGSCGDCSRCVEACPVRAYTGVEFRPEDPREVRFRAHVCHDYMEHREKKLGARACGLCVQACRGDRGYRGWGLAPGAIM